VPDGAFHLVPFSALVDARGAYRLERFEISYLGSGRDLLQPEESMSRSEPSAAAVVLGGASFDRPNLTGSGGVSGSAADAEAPSKGSPSQATSPELAALRFAPLPASADEAAVVAGALGVSALTGAQATEGRLRGIRGPRVLHIASHAFFLKDLPRPAPGPSGAPESWAGLQENPMLRSGLALSGANVRVGAPAQEDGLLTALEAATLDLTGTELVTLSACDTGLGEIDRGEGVLGLRRAFSLAGARSLLMSLWAVNDAATSRWMQAYYRRLQRGEGRSAALRSVQRQFLTDPVVRDPYYWAPFILAGEGGPLTGRPAVSAVPSAELVPTSR
jgi:CHAT domain-containing protein